MSQRILCEKCGKRLAVKPASEYLFSSNLGAKLTAENEERMKTESSEKVFISFLTDRG